jgi:O-antigen/teichoic acid export membrane protein
VAVREDAARLKAAYIRAQSLVSSLALPIGAGVALTAEPLILLTLGAKWAQSIPVIQAMAAIGALQSLSQLAYPLTMALGQTKLLFRRDVMLLIIRLAGLVTGGLLYGLPGVIGGSVLTVSIMIVINAFLVKELTGLPILKQFGANRRTLVAVSAMAAAVLLIRSASYSDFSPIQLILALVAEVALGAVVYLGTLVALWKIEGSPTGPESEVFDMARKVWRRLKKS